MHCPNKTRIVGFSAVLVLVLMAGAQWANAIPFAGDPYEPNDTTATATPIAANGIIHTHYCDGSPGADYLGFMATAGKLYRVDVVTHGYGNRGRLAVVDDSGTSLTKDLGAPAYYTFYGSMPTDQRATLWVTAGQDAPLYVAYTDMGASPLDNASYTVKVSEYDHPIVAGIVRDRKTGEPAAGALVRAWTEPRIYAGWREPFEWSSYQTTVTAADGSYVLKLGEPGRTWVRFEDSGPWLGEWYDSTPVTTQYGTDERIVIKEITAIEGSAVTGVNGGMCIPGAAIVTCVRGDTGQPFAGAQVALATIGNDVGGEMLFLPLTDLSGMTSHSRLDPRLSYTPVAVAIDGFEHSDASAFLPSEGETTSLTFTFTPVPSVVGLNGPRGNVDPAKPTELTGSVSWNGSELRSALATLEGSSNGRDWHSVAATLTGVDGGFRFVMCPGETLSFRVRVAPGDAYGGGTSPSITPARMRPTRLEISTPARVVKYAASGTIEGQLTSGDVPLANETVTLLSAPNGLGLEATRRTVKTDSAGRFSFTLRPRVATRYGVSFAGRDPFASSVSGEITIKPHARVGRPLTRAQVRLGATVRAHGYLEPQHRVGAAAVGIRCYRLEQGAYQYKFTVLTRDTHSGSRSRYAGKIRLPRRGMWKLKARHADAGHAISWSKPVYIRVD